MKASTYRSLMFTFLCTFLLVGCSTPDPVLLTSTPTEPLLATGIPTSPIPSDTPVPSATTVATITPTLRPPTWTPSPTLNPEDAEALLYHLLETNGGCRLPCFWGITPGKTTLQEVTSFLATFTSFSRRVHGSKTTIELIVPVIPESSFGRIHVFFYFNWDIVYLIDAWNGDMAPMFYLSEFLSEYGEPEEIWIRTDPYEERGSQPFYFALFYPEQGILMDYSGGDVETIGDQVRNCVYDLKTPLIFLWSPTETITFPEAYERFLETPGDIPYLPLEEASNMDVATFYESYKTPNPSICLETPAQLWADLYLKEE